jgi:hypothetical protein
MSTSTKATLVTQLRALIAGTQKHTPNGNLTFDGTTYAATALVALLQKLIDAFSATDAAKASYQVALNTQSDAKTQVHPVVLSYAQYLRSSYGNAPDTLGDYGLAPRKTPKPLTAAQLAARAAKAKATRAARGTKGPKANAAITGTVTSTETSSSTPATAAAPPAKQS